MSLRRLVSDLGRMCLQTASQSMEIQQNRAIHASIRAADSIRDAHRQGTRIGTGQVETMEGTTGAGIQTAVNTSSIDARLPTAETLKQQFDGVAYHELPLVYIRASKNNTLVTVMDNKVNTVSSRSTEIAAKLF